jgi:hypothetical protein
MCCLQGQQPLLQFTNLQDNMHTSGSFNKLWCLCSLKGYPKKTENAPDYLCAV